LTKSVEANLGLFIVREVVRKKPSPEIERHQDVLARLRQIAGQSHRYLPPA
jgi:hypothetical protein